MKPIRILIVLLIVSFAWQLENAHANILIYKNDTLRYAKAVQCKGSAVQRHDAERRTLQKDDTKSVWVLLVS